MLKDTDDDCSSSSENVHSFEKIMESMKKTDYLTFKARTFYRLSAIWLSEL